MTFPINIYVVIPEQHRRQLIVQVLTSIAIHCAVHSLHQSRRAWLNAKINPTGNSRPVFPAARGRRERETIIMLITADVKIIIIVIKLPAN